jgi:hypothetical protein
MNDAFVVAVQGLKSLDDIADIPANIELNAVRAINRTIERARTASARRMRQQVAFAPSYLNREDRLGVTKRARRGSLEARVTGRHRPTSLARFATNARQSRTPGARVMVKPGLATFLPKAFFINLRSGNTDTKNNVGLAIRLPEGQRPDRAYKPTQVGRNLWLLYGPSISQIFDDVAVDLSPATAADLEAEFLRLMGLER